MPGSGYGSVHTLRGEADRGEWRKEEFRVQIGWRIQDGSQRQPDPPE